MPYIGASPSNGVRKVHTYTATVGQTTFSGASNENITLSYSDGTYVDVYQNGILLGTADYTATSGTSIVLTQAASLNDIVVITVYDIFSVADTVSKSDGGTFDGNVTMGGTLGVTGATTLNSNMTVNNADINVTGTGNRAINLTSSDAIASMEIGGSTAAFIDFKMPSSDDFDMRVQSGATGGNISIASGNFNISGGATLLNATHSDAVTLYHNGNSKLATTSSGIDVTGTAVTDGLTVAGNLSVDGGTIKLDGNYPTGTGNLALGEQAMNGSISGNYNTALGDYSMQPMTSGASNTGVGGSALRFVTSGSYNTAVGNSSLQANTTASNNTAVGYQALLSNTTANNNAAFGYQAGYTNTTGSSNTALGFQASYFNSTANNNTAVGNEALLNNSTSSFNTAVGDKSLYTLASGSGNNTAIGHQSLYSTTTGNLNSGLGLNTMYTNTTGTQGTAVGHRSMFAHTTGTGNTAIGLESGNSITTASFNTLIGRYTADSLTIGSYNTHIGNDTDVSSASAQFTVAIGHGAVDKGTNTGFLAPQSGMYQGNNSSSWSTTSDRRIKKNISNNNVGLDAINQVQVRNFEYRTEDEITELPTHSAIDKQGVQLGVIAQEIQTVLPDMVKEESTGVLSVNPDNMTWYLVNAVKELSAQITELQSEIATLKGE
jgi:hypothetical protein